ncbi:MAG: hypothetical protein RDV48_11085 [Candidatus Eremiobacteraeota bacterium]|nr:hypothetical protein [Candidatus Eremiobacteraeota bacterium]
MSPRSYSLKNLRKMQALCAPQSVEKESTFIVNFRKLAAKLREESATERAAQDFDHMAEWITGKVSYYRGPLPCADQLGSYYEIALMGYEKFYEGLAEVSLFFRDQEGSHLDEGLRLAEEGEDLHREMDARIRREKEWYEREIPYAVA